MSSRKTNKNTLVCEQCGSSSVQTKAWVDANTDKVIDSCSDGDREDNWCSKCEEHVNLITKKEFDDMAKKKDLLVFVDFDNSDVKAALNRVIEQNKVLRQAMRIDSEKLQKRIYTKS